MSNNNGQHLSASARQILKMSQHIAALENLKQEHLLLLNYIIDSTPEKVFRVTQADLRKCNPPRTVRSELKKNETGHVFIEMTLVDGNEPSKPLIVLP